MCFSSTRETDIEHIVARSEAHDSGLCAANAETRQRFSRDLLNMTLASPQVNRHSKSDKDAAAWMPELNECWFAFRIVQVRRKYGLTIDRREADTLEGVLSACKSTEMIVQSCGHVLCLTSLGTKSRPGQVYGFAKVMHVRPAGLCLWDQPDLYRGFIATIEHNPMETE